MVTSGAVAPEQADVGLTVLQPSRATVMIKPVGALCNLDCTYCYYLPTKEVFGGRERRMSLSTLESVFAGLLPHFDDTVNVVWQGGEPTLAGLEFFRKGIEYVQRHARPGQQVAFALQTNCTLLDDDWCRYLRQYKYLVGASVDGPPEMHDHYRLTNRGAGSSGKVLRGINRLREHGVEYNLLCVLNDRNVHYPDEVWKYLMTLGTPWLQFIPAIEWERDPSRPGRNVLAPYSPDPVAYGRFLCSVFDRWFERHRDRVSVRIFDAILHKLVLDVTPFCILDGSCHNQLTVEHDGSVFGCDHFIERRWQLADLGDPDWTNDTDIGGDRHVGLTFHGSGMSKRETHDGRHIDDASHVASADRTGDRIGDGAGDGAGDGGRPEADWLRRVDERRLGSFAERKQRLPASCVSCAYKPYCHGGCPKHRELGGDVPEATVLCEAYQMFFKHAMPRMNWLASFLKRGEQPPPPRRR